MREGVGGKQGGMGRDTIRSETNLVEQTVSDFPNLLYFMETIPVNGGGGGGGVTRSEPSGTDRSDFPNLLYFMETIPVKAR